MILDHYRLMARSGVAMVRASDTEFLLPEGYRDGVRLDPEKTFVATVASAHMLSWLHIAFSYGLEAQSYRDTQYALSGDQIETSSTP